MFGIKNNKIEIKSDDVFGEKYLTITSDDIKRTIEAIYEYDVKTILIKTYEGYKLNNLEWLKDCSFIDKVHLFCYEENFELDGLHHLKNLMFLNLNVTAKKGLTGLDFSNFNKLQDCYIDWNPKIKNLFNCTSLQKLNLMKYKSKDLMGINKLTNLNELILNNSTIVSLQGLEDLNVNRLELVNLRNLDSLKGVEKLWSSLKCLEIVNCSKIKKIDYVGKLSNIEKLGINNSKQIESLKPIENLKKLKQFDFWGSTSILDGNIAPCVGIQKVAFENRKHYNYKNEEIDRLNQRR